jgi:RNA polymerase sigma-70 factor, ECF subfamily
MAAIPDEAVELPALLQQVRAGVPEAADRLLSRYRAFLHQVIQIQLEAQIRQRVDVSDVVQETQLEAARRLGEYLRQEPFPFRIWLRQLAQDQIRKARRAHLQTHRRTVAREVPLPERSSLLLARQLLAGGSSPSQHFARQEQARHLQQALAQLPDPDREIILMRTYEKLSFEEIGAILAIEPGAANMRHTWALLRLGKIWRENDPSGES